MQLCDYIQYFVLLILIIILVYLICNFLNKKTIREYMEGGGDCVKSYKNIKNKLNKCKLSCEKLEILVDKIEDFDCIKGKKLKKLNKLVCKCVSKNKCSSENFDVECEGGQNLEDEI